MRILITSIGRKVFLVKYLRDKIGSKGKIVTVDMSDRAPAGFFSDKFYKVPAVKDPSYMARIIDIVEAERIDLIIPFKDTELPLFARHHSTLEGMGAIVMLSSAETVLHCEDKVKTAARFRAAEVFTPEIYRDEQLVTFPLVWKPTGLGEETSGCYVAKNKAELSAAKTFLPNGMMQEFIDGQEYTLDVYCTRDFIPIILIPRKRLALRSYVSDVGQTENWRPFIDEVKRIAHAFKLEGVVNIQTFTTDRGHYYLEINPRIAGGFHLSLKAGFDFIAALKNFCYGDPQPSELGDYSQGLTMARYDEAVFF